MNKSTKLKGQSLLKLTDLTPDQLMYLLNLAARLKEEKQKGVITERLRRKNIVLIFEKKSTRTRCAFVVAALDEGAGVETLGIDDIHLGKKESIQDTARVLGRMFDGIAFRGFKQETVEALARYAGIPVWNGLTDKAHPTQALADLMTIHEYFKDFNGLKVVYIGDGSNNVCVSLMRGCAMAGANFVDCTPESLSPPKAVVEEALQIARSTGGKLSICADPTEAVHNANVIYTDVWTSMGQEAQFSKRIQLLQPYQVNMNLMRQTGNLDSGRVIFLHCLPALHNNQTELSRKLGALEVTNDVFEAPFSRVFDQAENRLHTIKSVMVATISEKED